MNHEIPLALALTGLGETTGAALLVWGLSYLRRDRAVSAWPRAEGVIVSSSYRPEESTSQEPSGGDLSEVLYTPLVTYKYTVDGKTFQGTRIHLSSDGLYHLPDALLLLGRYPPGARVGVLHDPAEPGFALLEARTPVGGVLLILLGSLFLFPSLVGMGLLLLAG